MKPISTKKLIASALCLTASMNALVVQSAMASAITCRDYYRSYVSQATTPSPTIIVVERPHYHGHYPVYHEHRRYYGGGYHGGPSHGHGGGHGHDGNHGGDDGDAEAAIALLAITTAGLITTTIVEDMKLGDAQDMIRIIDEAEQGDGANLRNFVLKVQSKTKLRVTITQVANAVMKANENLEFCRAGDLSSVDELAQSIALELSPAN